MARLTYWRRHSDSATMAHTTKAHIIVSDRLSTVEDNKLQPNKPHVSKVDHTTELHKLY